MNESNMSLVSIQPFLLAAAPSLRRLQHSRDHLLTEVSLFSLPQPSTVRLVPDTFSTLLLKTSLPQQARLIAPTIQAGRTLSLEEGRYFCVKFTPLASYCLYRVLAGAEDFVDQEFPAHRVFPEITSLQQAVAAPEDPSRALREINDFFLRTLRFSPIDPVVRQAISHIIVSNCSITGTQLGDACGFSSRHLYNLLRTHVGCTPKMFSRILRFQNALYGLVGGRSGTTPYELNYYDQSHFLHEFKAFCGVLPTELVQLLSHRGG